MALAQTRSGPTSPTYGVGSVAVCIATIPPREKLLQRALTSVELQTRRPDQIIVEMDENATGPGPTRNRAWRRADTEYVAILDDDDEFLPDHLAVCMSYAKRTRADVVYPWFELVGWDEATASRPDPLAVPVNGQLRHPLGVEFGREQALHLRRYAFIPITIVIKKTMLEKTGGYPDPHTPEWERYNQLEDWAFCNRLLDANARIVHAPKRTWRCHLGVGTGGQTWK